MAYSGCIIGTLADQEAPEPLLKRTIELNQSCSGLALASNGVVEVLRTNAPAQLEDVMNCQFDLKDSNVIMWFGQSGTPYLDDDVQPYTVLTDKDEKPILVAFAEGDFTNYFKPGETRSNTFFFVKDFLMPEVSRLYGHLKGDLDELMKELCSDKMNAKLTPQFGDRGTLVLVAGNGEIACVAQNELLLGDTEWGWSSNHYGFGQSAETTPVVVETEKPVSKVAGLSMGKKPPTNSPSVPVIARQTKPEVPKTETTAATAATVWGLAPEKLKSKAEFGSFHGTYSQDKLKDPTVRQTFRVKPEMLQQFKARGGVITADPSLKIADTKPATPVPKLEAPVMTPKELDDLNKTFITTLDTNELKVVAPDKIPDINSELPTFTDIMKLEKLEQTFNWAFPKIYELCTLHPRAAGMLILEYRQAYAATLVEDEGAEEELETQAVTSAATGTRTRTLSMGGKKSG